jgi:hypothetical protein
VIIIYELLKNDRRRNHGMYGISSPGRSIPEITIRGQAGISVRREIPHTSRELGDVILGEGYSHWWRLRWLLACLCRGH